MEEPALTADGREAWNTICKLIDDRFPFTQEMWRQKILRILPLLAREMGAREAGKEAVFEAAELVIDKPEGDAVHMMRDMDGFKRLFWGRYQDMDVYYSGPYPVKRWHISPISKPVKPAAEMKVVALCASPRKGGNTDTLLDEAMRGAGDAGAMGEKLRLLKYKIRGCNGCWRCREEDYDRLCAQKDDLSLIFDKFEQADAIIFGFPIYTERECAQAATFLDRIHCFRMPRPKLKPGRRGMIIGTWGLPHTEAYDKIMDRIMKLFQMTNIEVVEAISATGFVGALRGFDDRRRAIIRRFPHEMEKAYQAGRSLVTGDR